MRSISAILAGGAFLLVSSVFAASIQQAEDYFQAGQYPEALSEAEGVLVDAASTSVTEQAKLIKGNSQFALKEKAAALQTYEEFIAEHPQSENRVDVSFKLALCSMATKEHARGVQALHDTIRQFPEHPARSHMDYMLCELSYDARDYVVAKRDYDRFASLYPEDPRAVMAIQKILEVLYKQRNQNWRDFHNGLVPDVSGNDALMKETLERRVQIKAMMKELALRQGMENANLDDPEVLLRAFYQSIGLSLESADIMDVYRFAQELGAYELIARKAQEFLASAPAGHEKISVVYLALGEGLAYQANPDNEGAKAAFKQSLALANETPVTGDEHEPALSALWLAMMAQNIDKDLDEARRYAVLIRDELPPSYHRTMALEYVAGLLETETAAQ